MKTKTPAPLFGFVANAPQKARHTPGRLRQGELDAANTLAEALLGKGAKLNPVDDDQFELNGTPFVLAQTADPVMSRPGIGRDAAPIPGRFRWQVQIYHTVHGGFMEPDDVDLRDIGEPQDDLWNAVIEAAKCEFAMKVQNIAEGIYWQNEFTRTEETV